VTRDVTMAMSGARVAGLGLCVLFFLSLPSTLRAAGTGEVPGEPPEVTVFAAASTADVVQEVANAFTSDTGVSVRISTAGSGTLAQQLRQGADADVYVSASRRWTVFVTDQGLVRERAVLFGNRLVVVVPTGSPLQPFDLATGAPLPERVAGRIAMGDPSHVPAGRYGREALESFGWYGELTDRILATADVRAALRLVELGEVDAGIVYATDAIASSRVTVVAEFPTTAHDPIEYHRVLLTNASPSGERFYRALGSDDAQDVYRRAGFSVGRE